jgi:hypothetical protein
MGWSWSDIIKLSEAGAVNGIIDVSAGLYYIKYYKK